LLRVRDELHIVAALTEEVLRVSFLKIAKPDFGRRDVSCDRENGNVIAVAVE
jgi:hypothetical protein